jgi:hypothetical protein
VKQIQEAEPPSCLKSPLFKVGQDSHRNWVVQDQNGIRGGLFVDRAEALRFVRFEIGNHPEAFVIVNEVFELDMSRRPGARRILNSPSTGSPSAGSPDRIRHFDTDERPR